MRMFPMLSLSSRALRTLAAAGAALALAGCASTPPAANAPAGAVLQTAATHAYHGRFAVQYNDRLGRPQNVYGNFDWQEYGDDVSLELRSPLGQTLAVVKSTPQAASLELPNRQPQYATDVGELMQNTLGFSLPLAGLRYWLLPTPAPATPAQTVRDPADTTHVKQIRQDGWTIDYLAYADAPATGVKRVNLVRATPPLDIKLVLDQ
ncbi:MULTISPECIES: lipoprotein insertase outer membrane protein LolB [unclassified Burkholderia]|uniref:lipoprotein insertase outer membrane protein LolB n=1 Tax=unclassified Burkholderia TaxID=2613784 RepID=UPI000F576C3E|nr:MULTISPECIES: lipoprotein insertase outer membrane protein LolB [unclassified Burkholderia]RQR41516.1 lipoprotein localization protein LolB [Burkholderia sp. Bp9131]RQR68656.1 lipoprotein localization protein LolB [Burkholderia sp. Bp9015]RQR82733.1 lipoprotein localization protein LolB [Burkholderia sp. Bp9011]RQR93560.1 lipoprotein localization protein LolB [Burkholderia sp. Bp9010]RQR93873.1 lipoprotein localization protein LolB [Burkholderia sp. Bp8994]